jgi:hypothetical protein
MNMNMNKETIYNYYPDIFEKHHVPPSIESRNLGTYELELNNIGTNPEKYKDNPMSKNINKFKSSHILSGIQESSNLSRLFFSQENITEIQRRLKKKIYDQTGEIIDRQNVTNLVIIMRSIYLQYSRNYIELLKIKEEINRLDELVINEILPKLLSQLQQYNDYLKDISSNPVPIVLPVNPSSAGTKILRDTMDVFYGEEQ